MKTPTLLPAVLLLVCWVSSKPVFPAETVGHPSVASQWGGSSARNNALESGHLPVQWNLGAFDKKTGEWVRGPQIKNVRWVSKLGSESYGSAVVAGSTVFCATNNAGYDAQYPADVDLGCLVAFRASDGKFLWQYSAKKLKVGRDVDYPKQGICSSPVVESNRLWLVTNRSEIICLDAIVGNLLWSVDMMKRFGSVPRYMTSCSPTTAGDLLLSGTSNGVDTSDRIPSPEAPSFIALDKRTGAGLVR